MLLKGYYQNAYVTRDIERAVACLQNADGVDEFRQFDVELEVRCRGRSGIAAMKAAFGWVDGIQYELIEPRSGLVDLYTEGLPADALLSFHHLGLRADDWESTLAGIRRSEQSIVCEGETASSKFVFVDTRSTFGHYLEYVWMPPPVWTAMGYR